MADIGSFLTQLPTGIAKPLDDMFKSGATLINTLTGNVTGDVTGDLTCEKVVSALTMAAVTENAISVTTSCSASTASSQAPIKMTHTMTGVGAVGGRAEFNTTYNAAGAAGGWTSALKGNFTFGASCTGGVGVHSAICAEMTVPNCTVSGGHYAPLELELNIPASHVPQDKNLSLMYFSVNTTPATFDTYGTLFELAGVTGADNKVFDDSVSSNAAVIEATLRIAVNGTYWYIPLADQPNLD